MLLHKNERILLCTGNMLYNINHQIGFGAITVFGVGEFMVGALKKSMLSSSK